MNTANTTILRTGALAALLGILLSIPAVAQTGTDDSRYFPETANDLLDLIEGCRDDSCMSYVTGAISGIAVYTIITERPSPFCSQADVKTEDIRSAIIDTIRSTPALQDQHPVLAILTAFGRNWPCMSADDINSLRATSTNPVSPEKIGALMASGGAALIYGDEDAADERTIIVFHDPNCSHCRRFSDETAQLAQDGWKVIVFPVATTTEDSAGYGAVQIALRDLSKGAVEALYRHEPEGVADIILATTLAEAKGLSSRDILTAIARSDAYTTIENNTRAFFDMGAQGTPSWIVGNTLYGGFLKAEGIEAITRTTESPVSAPSEKGQDKAPEKEQ